MVIYLFLLTESIICRCENGPTEYTIDQFQKWDDYVKNQPMLIHIRSPTRLYATLFKPKRSYQTTNVSSSQLSLCMQSYFKDLEAPNVDEDSIVTTMTDMKYADMSLDTISFLLKDNSASKGDIEAVLALLGTGHPKTFQHAFQHEFLYRFPPIKL